MEQGSRVYPLSRYWYSGDFRFYYAYGNTPAQDFLQNCSGVKEPTVLVLGCGDIRSCFYSFWKNFDVPQPRFDGVHYVLNDISAAVLARNILFLYLCLQMPEEEHDLRKWLSGMWAIWYCHELYPEHDKLLHDSLGALYRYSEDWSKSDNPLHSIVRFASPATLSEIRKVWKMWLERSINVKSVSDMQSAREGFLKVYNTSGKIPRSPQSDSDAFKFIEDCTEIPFEMISTKKCDYRKHEVLDYVKCGSVFADEVLGAHLSGTNTVVNLTQFEREDGKYSLHYCSLPFRCYYLTVDFTRNSCVASKFLVDDKHFMIDDKHFKIKPLLANCVQQFSLWIQSTHRVLNSEYKVSFTFDCSHVLSFCSELEYGKELGNFKSRFDLVYTSNLMDHLSPPNLILSAIPLLKQNGLLFTGTLLTEHIKTLNYINKSFGLDCKLFPTLFGFRCINHEGRFSSSVAAKLCPIMQKKSDFVYHESLMVWEKLHIIPLVISSGEELPHTLASALCTSVEFFVYPLIKTPDLEHVMNNLCVETAMKVFQTFMSNSCADFNPQFWKPLTDLLQVAAKPYLHSLQTQLLLHGIHMHLTLSEKNCPMCSHVPICDSIGVYSAKTFQKNFTTPRFMALVHKGYNQSAEFLCRSAIEGEDVHIFDCIAYSDTSYLHLCFYGPLYLAHKGYSVTIVASCMSSRWGNIQCNIEDLRTVPLGSLLYLPLFDSFKFFQASVPDVEKRVLPSFGTIFSHDSKGDCSVIEIDLTFDTMTADKLQFKKVSPNTVHLSFGEFGCQLQCPYPIVYGDIKATLKRRDKRISMCCPRASQDFLDEKPLFTIDPDKLSPFALSENAITSLSRQQFTRREHEALDTHNSQLPSLLTVKISLLNLFLRKDHFYRIVDPSRDQLMCLILVNNNALFDYESCTPVVDLAFCFLEESFEVSVSLMWNSIVSEVHEIHLNETDCATLKKVLQYFSRKTVGTGKFCEASNRLNQLTQKGIEQYFTRAVITMLLRDVDEYTQQIIEDFTKDANETEEKCENCNEGIASLKTCSRCKKAKYCGKKCQHQHWKLHKLVCVKPDSVCSELKEQEGKFYPFPLARYWYSGDFRFYYAFGNTAAEDMLQNCSGVEHPMILSLGCGDIRSCFYTLWKNFDHSISGAPKRFNKVHFVLNDCSSPVQARNIMFIHLCLQLPQSIKDMKRWLCGMWAIWYCHELYPQHQKMLDDSLTVLLKYSSSIDRWTSAENPLGRAVRFTSFKVLDAIAQTWKMWLDRKVDVPSVQHMHYSRCLELKNRGVTNNLRAYAISYSSSITYVNGRNITPDEARSAEVIAYTESGNCYAETVVESKLKPTKTFVNLTLYERPDGMYSLHYGSMPFSGYYHTVEFSPDKMKSVNMQNKTMLVQSKTFKRLPFLANSVQQFGMWVQSANKALTSNDVVTFSFNNDDALSFCQELQHLEKSGLYDAVYSSNLIDHLGPLNIVLGAIHLLKDSGLLFTTTLLYKQFSSTLDEFISVCFGFDCKLLPVTLGIRCINHEGAGYSSLVMIDPTPVDMGDVLQMQQHSRMLIWEKVLAQPLQLSQLPPFFSNNITDALFDSVRKAAFSLLTKCDGQSTLNNSCIESTVILLQAFSSVLAPSSKDSYRFWEPLSAALNLKMKPFLHGLQTQLLLHNVHLHLTVTEKDCSICQQRPVDGYVGLFCADVALPIEYMTPHFMALVHCYSSSDAHYLCNEAMSGKDVHIFDSIDGTVDGNTLKLKFFVPLHFMDKDYEVTLALSYRRPERNQIITCLTNTSLRSKLVDFKHYSFVQTPLRRASKFNSGFGILTSHVGDGEQFTSEILLSESTLKALECKKLNVDKVSSDEIKLSCGTLASHVQFSFPVRFNDIHVKLSKSQGKITIACPRHNHNFTEEKPILITSPDHQLSLLPQHIETDIMYCHSGMQKNDEERHISNSCGRDHALMTPLMNVKETLMVFFQNLGEFFFGLITPEKVNRGFIIVHRRVFDYQCNSPVIDLAFCFLDSSNVADVSRALKAMIGTCFHQNIIVDDAEYEVLRNTLFYFAARSNGDILSASQSSRYQALCQQKVEQYFTRAVVYFLYCDADQQGLSMVSEMRKKTDLPKGFVFPEVKQTGNPAIDEKCDYCGKYCPITRKCTRCRKVKYCSKDCQTKHWMVHSKVCSSHEKPSEPPASRSSISACTFCGKTSRDLKKCKQCGNGKYCDRECQIKDWPKHKLLCKQQAATPDTVCCTYCGSSSIKLKACSRCGKDEYCQRECQAKHWNDHKPYCFNTDSQR